MNKNSRKVVSPSISARRSASADKSFKPCRKRTLALAMALTGALGASPVLALPEGGQVTGGSGTIEYNGRTLTIEQLSHLLSIDWQSFNIGPDGRVTFNQPSLDSIALNRVLGSDGSRIMGQLDANGRVFLINPNGVLFGEGASVDVGGLVASTLNLSNEDFHNGVYRFQGNGNPGDVTNLGRITAADGGAVALLGGRVSNQGVIQARLGSVALAAGNAVTLDFAGDGLLSVHIDEGVAGALVDNGHLIQADGGRVLMNAWASDALLETVVNNTGVIQARTLVEREGTIELLGSFEGGTVNVSGTLDASAPNGGDGGFIDTSGAIVKINSDLTVTTAAPQGQTGLWLIDPTNIEISYDPLGADDDISHVHTQTLQNNLATSNMLVQTVAAGGQAGNITVVDPIVWGSGNTLTLQAHNNININDYIHAPNGGLSLNAQGGISTGAEGHINVGTFTLINGNWSQVGATLPTFIARDFRLEGGTFTRATGGAGTGGSPWQITDIYGLQGLATTLGSAVLVNDIDASGTANWYTGNEGFVPIGNDPDNYTGSFDGAGFAIDGLTINRPGEDFVGLFGLVGPGADITSVGLTQVAITGRDLVGGLAGASEGSISNSYATGVVTGSTAGGVVPGAGGLVGGNTGVISNSYATATVTGEDAVGGLVGFNLGGSINTSYATGSVTGDEAVGGLVGANIGVITTSYATGDVTGVVNAGGLVGFNDGAVSNSYWDGFTTGMGATGMGGGIGAFAATQVNGEWGAVGVDAYNEATYTDLDFTNDWFISEGHSRPMLRAFLDGGNISNLYQLQGMAANLGGTYVLTGNIDASATASTDNADVWGGRGFAPVGVDGDAFTGSLDGQGFVINGLSINRSDQNYIGLFGSTGDASITGVGLTGVNISGASFVGGLAGTLGSGGSITQSYTTGSVTGEAGGQAVGGLVGVSSGDISVSYAEVAVDAGFQMGGLVGRNHGTISHTYATGPVTSEDEIVGGLVGGNLGTIEYSYATGSVTGDERVGGLVGENTATGTIVNAYASGEVTANDDFGGLVGDNAGSLTDAYWDEFTTGVAGATGVNTGTITDVDSVNGDWGDAGVDAYNEASYSFDFGNDWFIAEGFSRPMLRAFLDGGNISNLYQLQGMAANLDGSYVLTGDIDASASISSVLQGLSGNYSDVWGGLGFAPVGITGDAFTGTLNGQGFTINELGINRPLWDRVGLFGSLDGATVSNLTLDSSIVVGGVGVGTLAGWTDSTTLISQVHVVTGQVAGFSAVGGLVGGQQSGTIELSSAHGAVTADSEFAGGLVGSIGGVVNQSYTTADVSGNLYVGGLAGSLEIGGQINQSYAVGDVTGQEAVGGLLGWLLDGSVTHSYSLGEVDGAVNEGGLIGARDGGTTVTASYWLTDGNVGLDGVGSGEQTGVVGLDGEDFSDPASFVGWNLATEGGTGAVWRIYEGLSAPLLRAFLTEIDVIAYDDHKVFDGAAYAGPHNPTEGGTGAGVRYGNNYAEFLAVFGEDGVPYSSDAINTANLRYDGDSQGAINAGVYDITPATLWSNQQGYDIVAVDGVLTITAMPVVIDLTVSINDASKVYGDPDPAFTWNITSGTPAPGDSLTGTLTRQPGEDVGTYAITGTITGALAGPNYDVTLNNGVFTITPRPITISIADLEKLYGDADPELAWAITSGSLAFGHTIDANLSRAPGEDVGDYAITGTFGGPVNSANYDLVVNDGVLSIVPRSLTITIDDLQRMYGHPDPEFTWSVTDGSLAPGDELAGTLSREPGENVGTYAITGELAEALNGGNYQLTINNGTLSITPAPLIVRAEDLATYWNLLPAEYQVAIIGLLRGDTADEVLTGGTVVTNLTSPLPGEYTLTPTGYQLASINYELILEPGTLTLLSSHPGPRYPEALTSTQLPARESHGRVNRSSIYEGRPLLTPDVPEIVLRVAGDGINVSLYTLTTLGISVLELPAPVLFDINQDHVKPEYQEMLREFVERLREFPEVTLTVEGHTDSTGSDAINIPLSRDRAYAVAGWLIYLGVEPSRLSTVGLIDRHPAASNETREGRTLNRRSEVKLDDE